MQYSSTIDLATVIPPINSQQQTFVSWIASKFAQPQVFLIELMLSKIAECLVWKRNTCVKHVLKLKQVIDQSYF